jgi:hypothetical protein
VSRRREVTNVEGLTLTVSAATVGGLVQRIAASTLFLAKSCGLQLEKRALRLECQRNAQSLSVGKYPVCRLRRPRLIGLPRPATNERIAWVI